MPHAAAAQLHTAPSPGKPVALAEDLRLLLAPNGSPMTHWGTNTWILGKDAVTVIDPGPADPRHIAALLAALAPAEAVAQILVTHAHLDHSPGARLLAAATGAPVLAMGDARAGRSERMKMLASQEIGGGEGVDSDFVPDRRLQHEETLEVAGRPLRALHTPGHFGNHMCFLWGEALFSGDHVMGWAPSLVSPPDGDLTDFMQSLRNLRNYGQVSLFPGHGAPVANGQTRISELYAHRKSRESAIRAAIAAGADSVKAIAQRVYVDIDPLLLPAAERNVLAHLIDLEARGLAAVEGALGLKARISLIPAA
ncbi:MBL fold metallo-hydrolase [Pararhodobacter sp. SW119]|uniref:MBL fold metallo-hydrolase n=1 Tax=Pararhodobacter sp. SW119 TaxID=2780075 RepID=UPI001AE0DC95|nr:MBL fold metallo-hydrolase [Pararhodobacter sp. SW119]